MESVSKKNKIANITQIPSYTYSAMKFTEQYLNENIKIRTYADGTIAKFIVIKTIGEQKHWALHCSNDYAYLIEDIKHYYLFGEQYFTREKWFNELTAEQKYEAMWNI